MRIFIFVSKVFRVLYNWLSRFTERKGTVFAAYVCHVSRDTGEIQYLRILMHNYLLSSHMPVLIVMRFLAEEIYQNISENAYLR